MPLNARLVSELDGRGRCVVPWIGRSRIRRLGVLVRVLRVRSVALVFVPGGLVHFDFSRDALEVAVSDGKGLGRVCLVLSDIQGNVILLPHLGS